MGDREVRWQELIVKPQSAGIPTEHVVRRSVSFDGLSSYRDSVYWVESIPVEGRSVVASWSRTGGVVLESESIGNSVHAYGGGSYVATQDGLWIVDETDGRVRRAGSPIVIDGPGFPHGDLSFGDGSLVCVRETLDGDELVVVDSVSGRSEVAHRAAFLASPRLDGGRLAWVQWASDVMPWDSSEVWVATRRGGELVNAVRVAGGAAESAVQPQWGPDGCLYFLSDRTGWWNLYRWRAGTIEPVAPMVDECAPAPWELGYSSYAFLPGGRIGMIVQSGPMHRLVVAQSGVGACDVPTLYTSIKPYLAAVDDRLAVIGAAPDRGQEVALVQTQSPHTVEVIRGGGDHLDVGLSEPELIRIDSGGVEITVIWYPPAGGGSGRPPLIVRAHSGPTHHSDLRLDWQVQFFTSRGFAVADVDYRGSTGYGRSFRKALDGRWGEVDVEDCRNAATHLVRSGRGRPDAVFISGASAGGYTALRAVCADDSPFTLAVARSAIVNPKRWQVTAPRFQRPHATILSHEAADVRPDAVRRPVLLIHGESDAVAPVDDVVELADALGRRDLLLRLLVLPGAGHYLSAAGALATALEAELAAYVGHLTEVSARPEA